MHQNTYHPLKELCDWRIEILDEGVIAYNNIPSLYPAMWGWCNSILLNKNKNVLE